MLYDFRDMLVLLYVLEIHYIRGLLYKQILAACNILLQTIYLWKYVHLKIKDMFVLVRNLYCCLQEQLCIYDTYHIRL